MKITRTWHMPNSRTFKIKPIKDLIVKYTDANILIVDPFANEHSIKTVFPQSALYVSNDLPYIPMRL